MSRFQGKWSVGYFNGVIALHSVKDKDFRRAVLGLYKLTVDYKVIEKLNLIHEIDIAKFCSDCGAGIPCDACNHGTSNV
jgi:hypothetical protein